MAARKKTRTAKKPRSWPLAGLPKGGLDDIRRLGRYPEPEAKAKGAKTVSRTGRRLDTRDSRSVRHLRNPELTGKPRQRPSGEDAPKYGQPSAKARAGRRKAAARRANTKGSTRRKTTPRKKR